MIVVFALLCTFVSSAKGDVILKKGEKVVLYTDFGTSFTGWIASIYSNCLVLSDRNGRKGFDLALINHINTEQKSYSKDEIPELLIKSIALHVSYPSEKAVFWGGIANAGIPFWVFQEKKEALFLGGFDLLLLGGGIGAAANNQNFSIPIFLGLGGLKIWSAVDGASRIRKEHNQSDRHLCISIQK